MFRKFTVVEKDNATNLIKNVIKFEDIPNNKLPLDETLIKHLLEYARNDVSKNLDFDAITKKIADLMVLEPEKLLTMADYDFIIGKEIPALNEKSMNFRMDSRTLWSKFVSSLLNYSIALNSELDDKDQAEARIYANASKIANMFGPYLKPEFVALLDTALVKFGQIGVKVMQDLKAGIPLTDFTKELWNENINDISTLLSDLIPEYWPYEGVKSYFDTLVILWLDSIRARNLKDWTANDFAINQIDELVTVGRDPDLLSLADAFSYGVIYEYPDMFKL